jgi:heat shock protein HslJ
MTVPYFAPRRSALLLAALLAACTGSAGSSTAFPDDTPRTTSAGAASPGTAGDFGSDPWSLSAIDGQATTVPATFQLKDGQAFGDGGCNRYTGAAKLSGNNITFSPMAVTRMACVPDVKMTQEDEMFRAFGTIAHWRLDNGELVFSDAGGKDRLRFKRP